MLTHKRTRRGLGRQPPRPSQTVPQGAGYTVEQVCRWTGAKPQTLLYWVRTGLVRASVRHTGRRRTPVLFAFADLLRVGVIQELRARARVPLQRIRKALRYLDTKLPAEYRELFELGSALPKDLRKGSVYLDVSGEDIVIRRGQEALSAVRRPGQLVLVWVDLAAVRRELAAKADARV
jgi:DNA-binding transcriptional MerR regulator